MNNLEIEAVFPYLQIPAHEIWEILVEISGTNFPSQEKGSLYAETYTLADMGEAIIKREKPSFNIESEYGNFRYSAIGNSGVSFLRIKGKVIKSNSEAILWMNQISKVHGFILGRTFDSEFEDWQNAQDPVLFECAGRSTERLKWVNNGRPAPLNQDIIDISENPGRRILRNGYIEGVGHLMWIGDDFWDVTEQQPRCPPEWVEYSERLDGTDFLIVSSEPFSEGMADRYAILELVRSYYFPEAR